MMKRIIIEDLFDIKRVNKKCNKNKLYKNDLPSMISKNYICWLNDTMWNRDNDLPSSIEYYDSKKWVDYRKFGTYYKYNGYAHIQCNCITNHIYKLCKFLRGICFEFLKRNLNNDY